MTALPLVITAAMLIALAVRAQPILAGHTIPELLTGRVWQPMQGEFGFYPFIVGTLWVTALAMLIAVPPSLLTAIYLAEYARPATRTAAKPVLDLLAAIPSVVYGIWGVVVIVPWVGGTSGADAEPDGWVFIPLFAATNPTGFGVLAGSLVLAVMVTPVIIAISYEVLQAVPDGLREAALAIGTTRWQAVVHAVLPKALPGDRCRRGTGLLARVRRDDGRADGGGQCRQDALLDLRPRVPADRADRQQLRRDDVDSALRCCADGRRADPAAGGAGLQHRLGAGAPGRGQEGCSMRGKHIMWKRRHVEERFFKTLMVASLLAVAGSLGAILFTVIAKGLPALNWAMLTQTPKGGYYLGKEGGILNAILGSLLLAGVATVLALLIGAAHGPLPGGLRATARVGQGVVRLALDVMWGIPSIVYGAFGFTIMLLLGLRASLLGGILALTLLELPIVTRAMDEVIKMIPSELKESAFALGTTRYEVAAKVIVRQALPGIITGTLLAFGRGIGDAAAVLFTAGYTDRLPTSLLRPVASLPLAVFFQLGTPYPEVRQRAYAAALILTIIVLGVSLGSRLLAARLSRNVVK